MIRRIFSNGPFWLGAAVITKESNYKNDDSKNKKEPEQFICRPSDLPLYTPLHDRNSKPDLVAQGHHKPKDTVVFQTIESGIRTVRQEFSAVGDTISNQKKHLDDVLTTGTAHSKFIFDYLNEPDNTLPRIGAITIGGLSGLIFGLRGGFIRRLLYTGIGSTAVASVCYPEEAGKYSQIGLVQSKKAVTIAYNFVFGLKPGDDVNAVEIPKIPTSFAQYRESISDLARSAKEALFSQKK